MRDLSRDTSTILDDVVASHKAVLITATDRPAGILVGLDAQLADELVSSGGYSISSVRELARSTREIFDRLGANGGAILITRHGSPYVALLDAASPHPLVERDSAPGDGDASKLSSSAGPATGKPDESVLIDVDAVSTDPEGERLELTQRFRIAVVGLLSARPTLFGRLRWMPKGLSLIADIGGAITAIVGALKLVGLV